MEIKLALKVNDKDNVATIFANGITDGTEVEIRDKKGKEIGIATKDIKKGEYVHVHNLDSMRGRGDWAKEGK